MHVDVLGQHFIFDFSVCKQVLSNWDRSQNGESPKGILSHTHPLVEHNVAFVGIESARDTASFSQSVIAMRGCTHTNGPSDKVGQDFILGHPEGGTPKGAQRPPEDTKDRLRCGLTNNGSVPK